jgi:YhcH/YjgK/YiaL family protein
MILDNMMNCKKYEALNRNFEKAFEFLKREDLGTLPVGKYEIHGENVFAMVQEYETKDLENAKYEAHRKYIDIQYLIEGTENMGYAAIDKLEVFSPYSEENDFMLLTGKPRLILLNEGEFFILFPEDAHMPGVFYKERRKVKKVVVKVMV